MAGLFALVGGNFGVVEFFDFWQILCPNGAWDMQVRRCRRQSCLDVFKWFVGLIGGEYSNAVQGNPAAIAART